MKALLLLLIAAFGGAGIWLIAHSQQLRKNRELDRRIQTRKLGWGYDATREGRIDYRFSGGAQGVAWSMWYDSDRGDKSPMPKSCWQTNNVRAPRLSLVIIGRQRYQIESGIVGRILMDVVTGVAHAIRHDEGTYRADKSEFYESAVTLDEGRAAFRERYVVAIAPDMPRGWLDEELQKLLLDWPRPRRGGRYRGDQRVEATLDQSGLRVTAQQMPEDFEFWNHLARLGEALAQRLRSVSSP
jgi:hypothetical protein